MSSFKSKDKKQKTCSHCGRPIVNFTMTATNLAFTGNLKIKKLDPNVKLDFCSTACLHEWLDKVISEA
jgi:hypothetical protein